MNVASIAFAALLFITNPGVSPAQARQTQDKAPSPSLDSVSNGANERSYWIGAGAGRTRRSSVPKRPLIGYLEAWGSIHPIAVGYRYAGIDPIFGAPPHREHSILAGIHTQGLGAGTRLLVAGGVASVTCERCDSPESPARGTGPPPYGVSSIGLAYQIEGRVLIGPFAALGIAVVGVRTSTLTYLAPTMSVQLGQVIP
jgi:hypothetical protein